MLKLCIACSSKVPLSSRTCVCGHVFSPESRRIGGKRFSGYRVGITRQSSALREKHLNGTKVERRTMNKVRKPLLYHYDRHVLSLSPKRNTENNPRSQQEKAESKKRPRHARLKENRKKDEVKKLWGTADVISSPEERLRLSLALAEINRRLASQTMIWRMLPIATDC